MRDWSSASRVEALELRPERLVDLLAANLQGRCEHPAFHGERAVHDRELLDGLVARELSVDLLDALLDERPYRLGPRRAGLARVPGHAARVEVRLNGGLVEPDAGHEVLLRVAVDDDLRDERVVGEALLDVRGRDVLAAGGDQDV